MPVLTLDIERAVAGGRMLARHEGQVVLVAGAIPGERVRARVERTSHRVVFASTIEVLAPSESRRAPTADPACGGLALAHVAYERQLVLKAEILSDAFRRIGKLVLPGPPVVAPSPEHGYRMRARLHVRDRRIGFFREGSRTICDAAPSGQLTSTSLESAAKLAHDLGTASMEVDAITVAENVKGSQRIAHVELARAADVDSLPPLPEGIDGISCGGPDGTVWPLGGSQTIRDEASDLGAGLPWATAGVGWSRQAVSFFQANRHVVGSLLAAVMRHATGSPIFDLYAGVGLFAVPLAAGGADVIAVEGDPHSGRDLVDNAMPWAPRLGVHVEGVEVALHDLQGRSPATVIVDPPRTGLSKEALELTLALQAPRLVYVSCDPATLARDTAVIVASGYGLTALEAFDMFPNTPHIETLAVFDRQT